MSFGVKREPTIPPGRWVSECGGDKRVAELVDGNCENQGEAERDKRDESSERIVFNLR